MVVEVGELVMDDAVRATLARLEAEDRAEREAGLPPEQRSRQVEPTTGRFLFSLAAVPGRHRGARDRRLARVLDDLARRGRARARRPRRLARARSCEVRGVAGERRRCRASEEWAELVEGDAFETLARTQDVFDLVFLDAEKGDYEALFALARPLLEPGALVVADNVLSHADPLAAYSAARQADPTLSSVTLPLDRGLELSVVLSATSR